MARAFVFEETSDVVGTRKSSDQTYDGMSAMAIFRQLEARGWAGFPSFAVPRKQPIQQADPHDHSNCGDDSIWDSHQREQSDQ